MSFISLKNVLGRRNRLKFRVGVVSLEFVSLILAAAVASTATLTASAATTTYYQIAGTRDATRLIALDGLGAVEEITTAPKLAFPGITLDEIPARATFYTTIYGDGVVGGEMTAVGMHENRHYSAGHTDKIALQCAVYDSGWIKGVVLALTNGVDGVYVSVFGRIKKNGQYLANRYYDMAADGTLSSRWLNTGEFWIGSYPSGEEGEDVFRAKELRIHGLSPSSTEARKALAFPGVKIADIADCAFVAGRRDGFNLSTPATDNWATYVTRWPASGDIQKLVMQFEHPTDSKKAAVIQLVDGEDGVYAYQSFHTWNGNANIQRFTIDADTGTVSASNKGGSSGATTADPPNYAVHDLYLLPGCVPKTPNKIKVFSSQSKTLTLDDIAEGDFTSRMYGGYIGAAFNAVDSAKGYNKKVFRDDETGNVTNIVVEFQVRDGSNTKCLVASFENGADGVYASGLGTKYSSSAVGYEFYKRAADGTETWYGSNPHNTPANCYAATWKANGYGVCDLRVTVSMVLTLDADRTWSELTQGETLSSDERVRIKVTDPAAVLTVDEAVEVGQIVFVDGTGATLQVASGKTLAADSISGIGNILNNGTLVKTGDGTIELPINRDSSGETIVSNGTLKVASATGSGTSHTIRVANGATFDVNGVQNIHVVVRLEEGATYTNGKVYNSYLYNAYLPVRLILDGNAVATTAYAFGLNGPGKSGSWLDLGDHTLTVNGGKDFMLYKTTVTGTGTVVIDDGVTILSYDASGGDDWTLDVRSGSTLSVNGTGLTVKDFVNGGNVTGSAKLTVKGTLTPGSAAIKKLTFANNAVIKATGTAQVVSETFSVTAAADGKKPTITINASDITKDQLKDAGEAGIAVLTVPADAAITDVEWKISPEPIVGTRASWKSDEGGATKTLRLFKPTGVMVIIR